MQQQPVEGMALLALLLHLSSLLTTIIKPIPMLLQLRKAQRCQ